MILSCGEALIDMLPRTTTLGEPAFSPYAGGAVFNTAIALGRLGAPSAFFSGISNDMLGQILTETLEAVSIAQRNGYTAVMSHRSGETEDVSIVHMAVGWGVPQLKVGSFSRSERMAKWNEGLRIEEAMGGKAVFAGRQGLPVL
mgnify:CR=1 FL=1